jgi:hypothetical protein
MTALIANAKNFFINSDYPMDKVIYQLSGSQSMTGGTSITIPHGLPFAPLVDMVWSYNSDFSVSYSDNAGPAPSAVFGWVFDLQVTVQADATNIYINSGGPASPATVYYRVFAFQPDDSNASLPATVSAGDSFVLNSGYNYAKLLNAGHTAYGTGAVNLVIPHNLGYIPQLKIWLKTTRVNPLDYLADDSFSWQVDATTSSITISNSSVLTAGTIYYRIYMDQ